MKYKPANVALVLLASSPLLIIMLKGLYLGLFFLWIVFSGNYGPTRYDADLLEAHTRAVNTFVQSKGFGPRRMRHVSLWNDTEVFYDGRAHRWTSIQLVAFSSEYGENLYTATRPPKKEEIGAYKHRELTSEELFAIDELRKGLKLSSPISPDPEHPSDDKDGFRILAPLRLTSDCLECHEGNPGRLIGAFAYTLIPGSSLVQQDTNTEGKR